MKRLLLLRHAKSSWDRPELGDASRPLAPRGERAAVRVAEWLRTSGLDPQLVLCSPAVRAVQTLAPLRPLLVGSATVVVDDELYGAGAPGLLRRLRQAPDSVETLLVIGHNPGMHDLAVSLAGAGDARLRSHVRDKFPTGALAVLELDGRWVDLAPGAGLIVEFVRPRELLEP